MSIGTFTSASLDAINEGKYDVALSLCCSAVDATAAKVFPGQNNNTRYKAFLKTNMRLITTFGMPGLSAAGISIKCANLPEVKSDEHQVAPLEEILYHIVRCGLIHECEIDQRLEFTEKTQLGDFGTKFRIPYTIVIGLLVSVVLAKENKQEAMSGNNKIVLNGTALLLRDLWGKGDQILDELR